MAQNSNDFLVSTADVAFYKDDILAFTGRTATNTSISLTMEEQEITGGKGDKTLYKFKYGRKMTATIEEAEWRLEYIAANVGSLISDGVKGVYALQECVAFDSTGAGTLDHAPYTDENGDTSDVAIELSDGSIVTVAGTKDSTAVTCTQAAGTTAKCTYKYGATAKRVTIDADSAPFIGRNKFYFN